MNINHQIIIHQHHPDSHGGRKAIHFLRNHWAGSASYLLIKINVDEGKLIAIVSL